MPKPSLSSSLHRQGMAAQGDSVIDHLRLRPSCEVNTSKPYLHMDTSQIQISRGVAHQESLLKGHAQRLGVCSSKTVASVHQGVAAANLLPCACATTCTSCVGSIIAATLSSSASRAELRLATWRTAASWKAAC